MICPPQNENMVADGFDQTRNGFKPFADPAIMQGVRQLELIDLMQAFECRRVFIHQRDIAVAVKHLSAARFCKGGVINVNHTAVITIFFLTDPVAFCHFGRIAVDFPNIIDFNGAGFRP